MTNKQALREELSNPAIGNKDHLRKIALALLDELATLTVPSEPVYQYRIRNGYNGQVTEWQTICRDQVDFVLKSQPHNAEFQIIAPPALVVPDEMPESVYKILCQACGDKAWIYGEELWKACRDAMLQGKE